MTDYGGDIRGKVISLFSNCSVIEVKRVRKNIISKKFIYSIGGELKTESKKFNYCPIPIWLDYLLDSNLGNSDLDLDGKKS